MADLVKGLVFNNIILSSINNFKDELNDPYIRALLFVGFIIYTYKDFIIKEINKIIKLFRGEKSVVEFRFYDSDISEKIVAIMNYIIKNIDNCGVNNIKEAKYYKKGLKHAFKVNQTTEFKITDTIYGKIHVTELKETENQKIRDYNILKIYSYKDSIKDINEFINTCLDMYNKDISSTFKNSQYIITIKSIKRLKTPDEKKEANVLDSVSFEQNKWHSNITFDSCFFPEKDTTINRIEKFINNEEWYRNQGFNYTLGILLSGRPGCGKTSFIKAFANYTKRHIIDIKLDKNFDFKSLEHIIRSEKLGNIIIPYNERIILIEDIDATITDVVKQRNYENEDQENKDGNTNEDTAVNTMLKLLVEDEEKSNKNSDNNLSYLLNILDGVNETPGRILIMTTNHPEMLDKALIRPGRIDIQLELKEATEEDLKKIITNFWINNDTSIDEINEFNSLDLSSCDMKFTPAEIINICRSYDTLKEIIDIILG